MTHDCKYGGCGHTRPHRHIIARGVPDSGARRLETIIFQKNGGEFEVEIGATQHHDLIDETPAQYAARNGHLSWRWSNDIHAMQFLQLSKEQHNA